MKILHVIPAYYPAFFWGGPIFSTKHLCDGLALLPGVTVEVLTTDSAGPAVRQRVNPSDVDLPYRVTYARRIAGHSVSPGLLMRLPLAVWRADVVHLTATYSFTTVPTLLVAKLLGRPVVWSPRGEMQATAEWPQVSNRRIKVLFERLANLLRPRSTLLHLTADSEAKASVGRFPGVATVVIPNAVAIPEQAAGQGKASATRLIFLSRLHEKKGIDRLLQAMAELPDRFSLDIYGAGDPVYVGSLKRMAQPFGDRVRFHGLVDGDDKERAYLGGGIFVLPSHSENFGNVIAEALAHGLPVITTTRTPWHDLDMRGCGLCIDPAATSFASAIRTVADGDIAAMGERGRAWMLGAFGQKAIVDRLSEAYRALLAQSRSTAAGGLPHD